MTYDFNSHCYPERQIPSDWCFVRCYGFDMRDGVGTGSLRPRIHAPLFGYYTVEKTENYYIFTLVETAHLTGSADIGKKTIVPLSEKMGEGDFDSVTSEKVKGV